MTTATITVSNPHPTKYDITGGVDFDVTITIGHTKHTTIEGGITLAPDPGNDGILTSHGGSIDGWCSDSLVAWMHQLTDRSCRDVASSLAGGEGFEDVEVEFECDTARGMEDMTTNTNTVRIEVLGGPYSATPAWVGNLEDAPVTLLVPEGIVSDRTTLAAARMRADVAALLETHDRVEVGAVNWAIRVSRERALVDASTDGITVDLDTPNGPVVEYGADDDEADVESEVPDGWSVDWETAAYRLATGRLRSPLVAAKAVPAPRFLRTDSDSDEEVLTLVKLTSGPLAGDDFVCADLDGREYPYLVQITTGPDDDFVGLYDLDGEQVDVGNAEWEAVTEAPAEVIEQVEAAWESGSSVVTRIAETSSVKADK